MKENLSILASGMIVGIIVALLLIQYIEYSAKYERVHLEAYVEKQLHEIRDDVTTVMQNQETITEDFYIEYKAK